MRSSKATHPITDTEQTTSEVKPKLYVRRMCNPPNPYMGYIPGGFKPGSMIRVQGFIPDDAIRFSLNLHTGPNKTKDDLALHNEFRFGDDCLVRNHRRRGVWGAVEEMELTVMQNCPFEAILLCRDKYIKMAVNGQQLSVFPHRLPFSSISHLSVEGDIRLSSIGLKTESDEADECYDNNLQYTTYNEECEFTGDKDIFNTVGSNISLYCRSLMTLYKKLMGTKKKNTGC